MSLILVVDGMLALLMMGLAWAALNVTRPTQAVVLFAILGLVASLVWARLGAPDVALAEAAIGAGLTGALLFAHLRATAGMDDDGE